MQSKKEIRTQMQKLFYRKSIEELLLKSAKIKNTLIEHIVPLWYKDICIYEDMSDEVKTEELIIELRGLWYNIYTPQVISETEMILISEDYGIYEEKVDLFIVPGRAFSRDGKRLWRGKWYYDRFLEKELYKKSELIWICFDFQILEHVPTQKHDKNMNLVINNSSQWEK